MAYYKGDYLIWCPKCDKEILRSRAVWDGHLKNTLVCRECYDPPERFDYPPPDKITVDHAQPVPDSDTLTEPITTDDYA